MSIVSTVNAKPKKAIKITFPCIAKTIDGSLVVLFTSKTVGTVLVSSSNFVVGEYSRTWASVGDQSIWAIFREGESVTLTQKG